MFLFSILYRKHWKKRHELMTCSEGLTLQSNANLLASMMAAFLSLSDSKANTKECPCFGCQNSACAAAFPPPRTPQSLTKQDQSNSRFYYKWHEMENITMWYITTHNHRLQERELCARKVKTLRVTIKIEFLSLFSKFMKASCV